MSLQAYVIVWMGGYKANLVQVRAGVPHRTANRLPWNFVDPDSFVPERWLPEAAYSRYADDRKGASEPFMVGPRGCLGKR